MAAICLGALGWFGSEAVRSLMPPQTDFGWFNYVNVVLGVGVGWVIVGKRAGRGYVESLSAGLTGLAALLFWAFFVQSLNEMLRLALERRYDDPAEALIAIFQIAIDYAKPLLDAKLIGLLVGGALGTGILSEWAARRWS